MNFDLDSKYHSNHRSVLSENSEVTEVKEDTDENKATGKVATATNVGGGRFELQRGCGERKNIRSHSIQFTGKVGLIYHFDSLLERLLLPLVE